jgi:hypothetical protein
LVRNAPLALLHCSGEYAKAMQDWKDVEQQLRLMDSKPELQAGGIDAMLIRMNWAKGSSTITRAYERYLTAVRASLKRTTLFLRRDTDEMRMNNYNPLLLSIWEANMDIQVSTAVQRIYP